MKINLLLECARSSFPAQPLVFTDQPVGPKTQSAPGFKILRPGEVTQG